MLVFVLGPLGGPGAPEPLPPYAPTYDGPPVAEPPAPPEDRLGIPPSEVGPPLQIPWTCGDVEYCTQGHNGGSHTGTSAWAWDFSLTLGEEIWAASSGVVTHLKKNSNVGGCSSTYSSDANYITIDHGDGTSIVYLHMQQNSTPLAVGEMVEVGDLVARVGETGYACGAHLHMQVQNTCGSYYCQSVTASFADYGDPAASTTYESTNCPECPKVLDGGQTVIDDEHAGCLVRETSAWWSTYEGHAGHHFYTNSIDAPSSDSTARWRFGVTTPGDYDVEVFVPDTDADTTNARYVVHHGGLTDEVAIDQSTQKGWQLLGTFEFTGGGGERIVLGDATGEGGGTSKRVAFDAVRLTYVPSAGTTTAGDGGGADGTGTAGGDAGPLTSGGPGGTTGDGGFPTGPDWSDSGTLGGGNDSLGDATGPGLPPGFGDGGTLDGGCACSAREPSGGSWPWLGLLLLWRRRRRVVARGPGPI